ncbi:MAG: hypothetical protein KGH75_04880 [Rhodospirillales bacterium]|nr:hypothetical protein [Rhodospirillales bacterium]
MSEVINQEDQTEDSVLINFNEDKNLDNAVASMMQDLEDVAQDESKIYVFEQMMSLLKQSENNYEAIALARLALAGSTAALVEQNAILISLVQNLCSQFEVTVKTTKIVDTNVYEQNLPIKAGYKYDIKTLQMGVISLIAKMNHIVSASKSNEQNYLNAEKTISVLKAEGYRLGERVKDLQNAPPPQMLQKPYRIMRSYTKDGQVCHSFICKDEELGYKSTKNITKSLAWEDLEKAVDRLIHLNQNATEYSISKIYEFNVVSLHHMTVTKGSPESQLALSNAKTFAAKALEN